VKYPCCRLVAAACAGFVSLMAFSQNAPSFTAETSASGPTPYYVDAVDVNNDGLTDIVQSGLIPGNTSTANGFFTVSINNGNGTFRPPVTYPVNWQPITGGAWWPPLTWGDFNNDGKLDIAFALPGTNQIAIYLGNGDGTFQSPITSTIDLPSGSMFAPSSIVAADFNHDGNLDLVAAVNNGNENGGLWSVDLLQGDGTGHFASPTAIYYPTSGWTVQSIVGGDFDTDGNADVSLLEEMTCSDGINYCWSNIVTLFGDGATTFDPVDVTSVDGTMSLGSADLNNDGATDLYGIEYGTATATPELAVFLGHYDRRFSYSYTAVPAGAGTVNRLFAVAADFNGTQNWALAALATTWVNSTTPNTQMIYFLDAATSSVTIAYGPSPAGIGGYQAGPVLGNFNGDRKPDIAVNQSPQGNSPATTLAVGLNANTSGFYGACNYPVTGQGIRLCSPSSQTPAGPLTFAASANSFGQLRKMELWVDGAKLAEQHWIWGQSAYFDWSDPSPSPGAHSATIYAANIDNTLQRYDFTFTVGNP
jgi:hypothetical protein